MARIPGQGIRRAVSAVMEIGELLFKGVIVHSLHSISHGDIIIYQSHSLEGHHCFAQLALNTL